MFLVYPPGYIGTEIVGLFFITILQYVKLNNANTANKTEVKSYHIYTILYIIPVAGGYFFYFYWQIYCLYFDVILSSIGFVFLLFEIIFSLYEMFTSRCNRYRMSSSCRRRVGTMPCTDPLLG